MVDAVKATVSDCLTDIYGGEVARERKKFDFGQEFFWRRSL